jgi:2-keto-3-deoxy-L-rhamnonate aldolase RhmA
MHFIRKQVLSGQFMAGAWCNLASGITAEMAAIAGFDWILIDQEHGPGDSMTLLQQIQAIGTRPCAPITRIAWNEMPRFKQALDLGSAGIMIPYIETAEDAARAVSYMHYPPAGVRGVASSPRATGFATNFDTYFADANHGLLTVTQIETARAVQNAAEIAAVEGVDVLFVGPMDLSISVGLPGKFEDQNYRAILTKVATAARECGKAAGILLPSTRLLELVYEMGYRFVAAGSDGGMVMQGMQNNRAAMANFADLKQVKDS